MKLTPGGLVADRYELVHPLGEGGMGSVWSARHLVTEKLVALKFLKDVAASDPAVRKRLLREAKVATAVDHPNVVAVHDILWLEDGSPVMVMDLLTGETFGQKLDRERRLTLRQTADILVPVLSAVGTAHSVGIIHRDLKPDNIFLTEKRTGQVDVKVLDFGIAKLLETDLDQAPSGLTTAHTVLGTPYYMSPEQACGEPDIDQRADVWAIGVILYESLAGQRPIEGDTTAHIMKKLLTGGIVPLEKLVPDLPKEIADLVGTMLQPERDARLPDLMSPYEILREYSDVPSHAFPRNTSLPPPLRRVDSGSSKAAAANPFAETQRQDPRRETTQPVTRKRSPGDRSWGAIGAGLVVVATIGAALAVGRRTATATHAGSPSAPLEMGTFAAPPLAPRAPASSMEAPPPPSLAPPARPPPATPRVPSASPSSAKPPASSPTSPPASPPGVPPPAAQPEIAPGGAYTGKVPF